MAIIRQLIGRVTSQYTRRPFASMADNWHPNQISLSVNSIKLIAIWAQCVLMYNVWSYVVYNKWHLSNCCNDFNKINKFLIGSDYLIYDIIVPHTHKISIHRMKSIELCKVRSRVYKRRCFHVSLCLLFFVIYHDRSIVCNGFMHFIRSIVIRFVSKTFYFFSLYFHNGCMAWHKYKY